MSTLGPERRGARGISSTAGDGIRSSASRRPVAAGRLRLAVISDATPGRNGVGTYYDDLVELLEGRLGRVDLVSPPPADREAEAGWRLSMPGDPTQDLFVPWIPAVWRRVKDADPDVIVAPTPGLYGLLAMVLAARVDARFCVAYHTEFSKLADLYWGDRFGFGSVARWAARGVDALMFGRASAVLVHNAELLEAVRSRGVAEVELMGTPAPPEFLRRPPAAPPERIRSVLFLGRLAPEKRVDAVLRAARALPDLEFRFVGDGPVRREVTACAAERDNVRFMGWVDRPRVLEILDDSDLLVLPSRHETFGSAAFEAMARRRLALVSSSCGIVEWPELAGGLFRMGPDEDLVDAIRRIRALPPGERRRVAERGRKAARALSRRTVDHWIEVVVGIARGGGTG